MQTITIKNFGPIVEIIDLPINDFMVFIGPQASGKSTIAKAIYFFKQLREEFLTQILSDKSLESTQSNHIDLYISSYQNAYCTNIIKIAFFNYYKNHNFQQPVLEYKYNDGRWIEIEIGQDQRATITVSPALSEAINEVKKLIIEFHQAIKNTSISSEESRISNQLMTQSVNHRITEIFDGVFGKTQNNSYTPASRSFLGYVQPNNRDLDIPSATYLDTVSNAKVGFSRGIQQYLDLAGWYPINIVSEALRLIGNVIGGDYRYDSSDNTEKIVLKNGQKIDLKLASSGQQEAIWIMLLALEKLVSKRVGFSAIEEPEAHLYPEAQRDIVQLIALLANQNSNQVLITTHSPYILSAINNLLYANQVGALHPDKASKIVSSKMWLRHEQVAAYFVNNGKIESIIDDELRLIKVESIDSASAIINEEYDKLFDLEVTQ